RRNHSRSRTDAWQRSSAVVPRRLDSRRSWAPPSENVGLVDSLAQVINAGIYNLCPVFLQSGQQRPLRFRLAPVQFLNLERRRLRVAVRLVDDLGSVAVELA